MPLGYNRSFSDAARRQGLFFITGLQDVCTVCILTYMARRNVYINQANEVKLSRITNPVPNLSGLINTLLADWFEKVGLK